METNEPKWSEMQEQQIVTEYRRTHSAKCPVDGAILEIRPVGTFDNPDAIIARCPTCKRQLSA
jgi:hypothetical protein